MSRVKLLELEELLRSIEGVKSIEIKHIGPLLSPFKVEIPFSLPPYPPRACYLIYRIDLTTGSIDPQDVLILYLLTQAVVRFILYFFFLIIIYYYFFFFYLII